MCLWRYSRTQTRPYLTIALYKSSSYPEYLSPTWDKDTQQAVVWGRLREHCKLANRSLAKINERYKALRQEQQTQVESRHELSSRDNGGGGGGGGGGPPAVARDGRNPEGGSNGTKLSGKEPTIFDSDRSKAEAFLLEWTIYRLLNREQDIMRQPFSRVMLFLTFIKGPDVQEWSNMQVGWLGSRILAGAGRNEEHL